VLAFDEVRRLSVAELVTDTRILLIERILRDFDRVLALLDAVVPRSTDDLADPDLLVVSPLL